MGVVVVVLAQMKRHKALGRLAKLELLLGVLVVVLADRSVQFHSLDATFFFDVPLWSLHCVVGLLALAQSLFVFLMAGVTPGAAASQVRIRTHPPCPVAGSKI
jgi:hypothetical protein